MLEIENMCVNGKDGEPLLKEITLRLTKGQAVGVTGRSGAGKSTLLKAIMGNLDSQCRMSGGKVVLHLREDQPPLRYDTMSAKRRRSMAGTTVGFIPQNAMRAFDFRLRIGTQLEETFRVKLAMDKTTAERLAEAVLLKVGLTDARRVLRSFPEELSGGMLQRVAIAMLLGLDPVYVLADEPTASLDRDNRAHVLRLLKERLDRSGILLVSHDAEAMRALCSFVIVLHDGEKVEQGTMAQLLHQPSHRWTRSFAERWRANHDPSWSLESLRKGDS